MTENTLRTKQVDNHSFMLEIKRLFATSDKKSVTFVVRGFSMRPFLDDGRDKVVLVPPRTPKIGDVVLAEIAERRYALHRVIKIEGDTYTMRGDGNPLRMKELFKQENIVGLADGFIRKGKYVSVNSRKWRFYSTMWRLLTPFRRILLAIYRRL